MFSINSQFIKTPGYIQVTGLFNQTGIGLRADDSGVSVLPPPFASPKTHFSKTESFFAYIQGELDPHGADLVHPFPISSVSETHVN